MGKGYSKFKVDGTQYVTAVPLVIWRMIFIKVSSIDLMSLRVASSCFNRLLKQDKESSKRMALTRSKQFHCFHYPKNVKSIIFFIMGRPVCDFLHSLVSRYPDELIGSLFQLEPTITYEEKNKTIYLRHNFSPSDDGWSMLDGLGKIKKYPSVVMVFLEKGDNRGVIKEKFSKLSAIDTPPSVALITILDDSLPEPEKAFETGLAIMEEFPDIIVRHYTMTIEGLNTFGSAVLCKDACIQLCKDVYDDIFRKQMQESDEAQYSQVISIPGK